MTQTWSESCYAALTFVCQSGALVYAHITLRKWSVFRNRWSLKYLAQMHRLQNDLKLEIPHLGDALCFMQQNTVQYRVHLLTLVVRCGFAKPLTVAPLTISLVDSLLQSAFTCVSSSAALPCTDWSTDAPSLLFTEVGRQRKPSHMDKLQSGRFSSSGPQEGECRLNSS